MYEIKDGQIMRGTDTISPQILVTQVNNIEKHIDKHNIPQLSSELRYISDVFEHIEDQSDSIVRAEKNLHKAANLLSAIVREVKV